MKISVIIATYNRPNKIKLCLRSIISNHFYSYEIVVIDQSNDYQTKKEINKLKSRKIKYITVNYKNKSKALNLAIKNALGKILVFTDDDCIVDKNWLKEINNSFKSKHITGVTGKSLPYNQRKDIDIFCPAIFNYKNGRIINKASYHATSIGFGNNMAFKKKVFEKIGYFKEWLGPGSVGCAAEDANFLLRTLVFGYKIMYNPKVIIFHNNLLSKDDFRKKLLGYKCGEVACYGYLALKGHNFANDIISKNIKSLKEKVKIYLNSVLEFKKISLKDFYYDVKELFYIIRGFIIAFYFAKKDPLGHSC
ncbi:MAG: hypothetical protein A2857_02165 [Candidatus Levybacteria bacterium RIFCSPHIGHO2_01_FULL_36_15]|nr:MAG: hypothetical protein A2857_02165 [Candidatus Levybacteria bacterium RIFCSPHIGHO2_01_FULL_36_15]